MAYWAADAGVEAWHRNIAVISSCLIKGGRGNGVRGLPRFDRDGNERGVTRRDARWGSRERKGKERMETEAVRV